jgi:hypothetical protein
LNNWINNTHFGGNVRICALILLSPCLFAGSVDDRDFHGNWKLNPERSDVHTLLPLRPAETLAIEQNGSELHCRISETQEEVYSLSHKPTTNKIGNGTGKSILKWEGAALLFDTLVDGDTEQDRFTLMERWKLVKEGQRLLIHREIVRRTGQSEADLVYDRK